MNLFQIGNFTLASGAKSSWKLECDALSDGDWAAVAEMVKALVPNYMSVEGVPTGGLKLAKALEPVRPDLTPLRSPDGPVHLIVDDVLTTGGSLERVKTAYMSRTDAMSGRQVVGVVLFARGQCPYWVKAIFQMPEIFWIKPRVRG